MGIVVIGAVFVDIKGYPLSTYIPGGRNAGRIEQVHGGVSRNVVEDIANVELRPTFVGLVDDTGMGQDVIDKLAKHKVNTRFIQKKPDGMGTWLAIFDNDGDVHAAISSVGVVGILLAGWSSNNKYSLIGAMRSGAQIISYELSIGMTMLAMICLTGTMSFSEICEQQAVEGWNIFRGHVPAVLAFIIYLIAGNAECNRGPFDLPESESELTAGYHTEYSGMHFGYYYLAEYLNLFICAGMASTIFLGGWAPLHIAGLEGFNHIMDLIPGAVWFLGKAFFVVFLLMWLRWTFPRLRIDQILSLEWKYLVPITMFNLVLMALLVSLGLTF